MRDEMREENERGEKKWYKKGIMWRFEKKKEMLEKYWELWREKMKNNRERNWEKWKIIEKEIEKSEEIFWVTNN